MTNTSYGYHRSAGLTAEQGIVLVLLVLVAALVVVVAALLPMLL